MVEAEDLYPSSISHGLFSFDNQEDPSLMTATDTFQTPAATLDFIRLRRTYPRSVLVVRRSLAPECLLDPIFSS